MPYQIVAVRTVGGEMHENVVELLWREDQSGEVHAADRQAFAEWMTKHPSAHVYVRDAANINCKVSVRPRGNQLIIQCEKDGVPNDALLHLPRYVTETS